MRIGLVELLLILLIAALTIGPSAALWVERWMRRAQKTSAAAARRRAAQEAQRAAEREAVLQRFQVLSLVFALAAAAALVWALVLRPIDPDAQPYTAPDLRQTTSARQSETAGELALDSFENVSCIRVREDWVYAAVRSGKTGSALVRLREDGSGLASILTLDGEITSFDFASDGSIWFTALSGESGALYRADYDGWGATTQQVVTQIDGSALHCPSAVAVGTDDAVYFTDTAAVSPKHGLESALRTALIAHTATGSVYVYDPAARTVEQVLGGIAGASGLALSPDGSALYVSDLGNRCIWSVDPRARELTAGGKHCVSAFAGLPGYPASLAMDTDGTLYISYRWARSSWLEDHASATVLRGAALRLSQTMQENLFALPSDAPAVEAVRITDGSWQLTLSGKGLGSMTAVCPSGSRVYLAAVGEKVLHWAKI